MIVFDDRKERLDQMFERVEFVGTSADNPDALERNVPVFTAEKVALRYSPFFRSMLRRP